MNPEEAYHSRIIVCQGAPRCLLEGDEAVKAQENGCVWCQYIYIDERGQERTYEPGNA